MRFILCSLGALLVAFSGVSLGHAQQPTLMVGNFAQEIHTPYTTENGLPSNDVRAVEMLEGGAVLVSTAQGLALFSDGVWQGQFAPANDIIELLSASGSECYGASMHKLYRLQNNDPQEITAFTDGDIISLTATETTLYVGTTQGLHQLEEDQLKPVWRLNALLGQESAINAIAAHEGEIAVATPLGFYISDGGEWQLQLPQDGIRRWAPLDVRSVHYDGAGRLWFACPQGVGCRVDNNSWKLYTGAEGLPFNDFSLGAASSNSAIWLGTIKGAVKFNQGNWEYREGRRWLLNNEVRDIAATPQGDVWFATSEGISRIEAKPMTLAEKAAFYEDEVDKYHRRTPFGYVTNAGMAAPGDKASAEPFVTDNDGQYTGLYAGAECLAYGATGDPKFKARATKVFEALAYLSEVTQGGSNPAPRGFIARAIMPIDGPNPNDHNSVESDKKKQEGDHLWKIMDPRWPTSEDGQWYWKSDTSSDELDGHYFAYGLYYDHVAETEEEIARCREVVARVTDHLIDHNFRLVDHDGTPTRWAHFAPEDLNDDRSWWTERGLNSLSLLTYLSIAHHVTGDEKYRKVYMKLVKDHQYALNGMTMPKLQFGPGSHVQFDDKMAFMNYYHLIRYETDPELLAMYYTSIYYYWNIVKYEMNPFFNFVYAASCQGKIRYDQWGELDVSPTGDWLQQSVDTLVRYPIDLANWKCTNSHRIDLVPLGDHTREPGRSVGKGHRVNGYVLPIDERQSISWSEDTWAYDTGGNGARLRDGAPYLLAYYMGLVHGYISE